MNEQLFTTIVTLIRIIGCGVVSIAACLYALPLCFKQQFHKPIHFLTLNVCITIFICGTFWLIYYTMDTYYPLILTTEQSCLPITYLRNMVNFQVFYALCVVSLNRLLIIVYKNKALFRTNKWAGICISAQWIFGALIPLPVLASNYSSCLILGLEFSYRIYLLIIGIVLPAIFLVITNSIIFSYTRRSTRRVHPINEDNVQAATLSHRDAYLLKHMIFMFMVFFCSWAPVYIMLAMIVGGIPFSPISAQIILTIPLVGLIIDIGDLFLYNHELRKYFTNRVLMNQTTRSRERPRE